MPDKREKREEMPALTTEVSLSDAEWGLAKEWAEQLVADVGSESAARVAEGLVFQVAERLEASRAQLREAERRQATRDAAADERQAEPADREG